MHRAQETNKILNDNVDNVIVQIVVMKAAAQNDLQTRLKRHLREVLSIGIDTQPWSGEGSLPAYLREAYAFFCARVLQAPCLFMMDRDVQPNTPAAIRKQMFEVGKRWEGDVVYVAAGIDSARRKQLIDQRVAFIVPGNQVYLPMLGIDLREHFRSVRGATERLGPATQAAFLHALYSGERDVFSPQEMAVSLGYSNMTLSRVFDELESAGLGRHYNEGKRRLMELTGSRRELWEKARPLLRSPISRRFAVAATREELGAPAAGLTALAAYTNLAEPQTPAVAVASAAWSALRSRFPVMGANAVDRPAVEVELWSYPPRAVAEGPVVDRLSLFLSLNGTSDERVESALDELLEEMEW